MDKFQESRYSQDIEVVMDHLVKKDSSHYSGYHLPLPQDQPELFLFFHKPQTQEYILSLCLEKYVSNNTPKLLQYHDGVLLADQNAKPAEEYVHFFALLPFLMYQD